MVARYETVEEIPEFQEDIVFENASTYSPRLQELDIEEHFIALRSYVAGIAEMGLEDLLLASYHSEEINPETLPFGFNAAMHNQIAKCLAKVAPLQSYYILTDLYEELKASVPEDWLKPRIEMIHRMYGLTQLKGKSAKELIKIAYPNREDRAAMETIWNIGTYKKYDREGNLIDANALSPIPQGIPGNPISSEGWYPVKASWKQHLTLKINENAETWEDKFFGENAQKMKDLEHYNYQQYKACRELFNKPNTKSKFRRSLMQRIRAWIDSDNEKWRNPLSPKQLAALGRNSYQYWRR